MPRRGCGCPPRGTGASAALLWDPHNNALYLGGNLSVSDRLAGLEAALDAIHADCARTGRRWLRGRGITEQAHQALKLALDGLQPNTLRRRLYAYRQETIHLTHYPVPDGVAIVPIDRQLLEERRPGNAGAIIGEVTKMWPSLDTYYRQGLGLAALAGDAAVCWCTAEYKGGSQCGIGMPHWDCSLANVVSVRLAERLGFEAEGDTDFLAWSVPE
ncbi:MAG: hypothetical protein ACM3ZA_10630 [Bacillota bacterium]